MVDTEAATSTGPAMNWLYGLYNAVLCSSHFVRWTHRNLCLHVFSSYTFYYPSFWHLNWF